MILNSVDNNFYQDTSLPLESLFMFFFAFLASGCLPFLLSNFAHSLLLLNLLLLFLLVLLIF